MGFDKQYDFILKNFKMIDIEKIQIIFKNGTFLPFHMKTVQE